MPQEQLEILKMVAEKVITPEEGERLLRALNEGPAESECGGRGRRGRHQRGGGWAGLGESISEMMGEFGSMMSEAFDHTVGDLDLFEADDRGLTEVPFESGSLDLPQGTSLFVKHRPAMSLGSKRADIRLEGSVGDRLTATGAKDFQPRTYRADNRVMLAFNRGPITVAVPSTVTSLRAFTAGGEIRASGLTCPAELKTMGGEIRLEKVAHEVKAKTLGGGVLLEVLPGLSGESRVITLGGDVELRVGEGVAVIVHAVTMGGEIDTDPGMRAERLEGGRMGKAVFALGGAQEGGTAPVVRLKTMGGSIRVRKA